MNVLQIFLSAFENRMNAKGKHQGIYVARCSSKEGAIKAFNKYTQEVWYIVGKEKTLIAQESAVIKGIAKEDDLNELYQKTIEKVLEYYGI